MLVLGAATLQAPPALSDDSRWLPLTATEHGRLYRRVLLRAGELVHPETGTTVTVDHHLLAQLVDSFDRHVTGYVPVQRAADGSRTEDPSDCVGEVVALAIVGDDLLAELDIRARVPLGPALRVAPTWIDRYSTGRLTDPPQPALRTVALVQATQPTQGVPVSTSPIPYRGSATGGPHLGPLAVEAEIVRLTALADDLGFASPSGKPAAHRVGVQQEVDRYVQLADSLGLSGRAASGAELPSLGR
jgi:hypothetical protein